jgi:hypothetical protein
MPLFFLQLSDRRLLFDDLVSFGRRGFLAAVATFWFRDADVSGSAANGARQAHLK